uniref:Uncharacterized protein n=1 Tax=Setaria italica TaxID=4555 RepID=K3ZGN7_SETIT
MFQQTYLKLTIYAPRYFSNIKPLSYFYVGRLI